MNTTELNYILDRCKAEIIDNPEFKAAKSRSKAETCAYISKNLDLMLNKILAREAEIVAIFTSKTENGEAMKDHLLGAFLNKKAVMG